MIQLILETQDIHLVIKKVLAAVATCSGASDPSPAASSQPVVAAATAPSSSYRADAQRNLCIYYNFTNCEFKQLIWFIQSRIAG